MGPVFGAGVDVAHHVDAVRDTLNRRLDGLVGCGLTRERLLYGGWPIRLWSDARHSEPYGTELVTIEAHHCAHARERIVARGLIELLVGGAAARGYGVDAHFADDVLLAELRSSACRRRSRRCRTAFHRSGQPRSASRRARAQPLACRRRGPRAQSRQPGCLWPAPADRRPRAPRRPGRVLAACTSSDMRISR